MRFNVFVSIFISFCFLDGTDVDSGTAWELGYAYAENKPIIGIRTDFRIHMPNEKVNLMIQETLKAFVDNLDDLKKVMAISQNQGEATI
ncbi:MAG: nucleoside 2-deoxyribosyltransferase [Methanimicrococcus sp.]|nr:nucleoside 2-deoxyribosyltransferase [Methanimicrococcus sp.]